MVDIYIDPATGSPMVMTGSTVSPTGPTAPTTSVSSSAPASSTVSQVSSVNSPASSPVPPIYIDPATGNPMVMTGSLTPPPPVTIAPSSVEIPKVDVAPDSLSTVYDGKVYYPDTETWKAAGSPSNVSIGTPPNPNAPAGQWKPDFRLANPWEGAPASYFRKEISGFVPTADNPLPPSLSFIQNNPTVKFTKTVTTTPKQLDQVAYNNYLNGTAEDRFKILLHNGYIPLGSRFVGEDPESKQVLFYDPETLFRNNLSDLWEKRVGILNKQQADTAKDYAERIANFEAALDNVPADLRNTYFDAKKSGGTDAGIAAYSKALEAYNKALEVVRDELAPYRGELLGPFLTETGDIERVRYTYDIAQYLSDKNYSPEAQKLLTTAGYSDASISALSSMEGLSPSEYIAKNPTPAGAKTIEDAGYGSDTVKAAGEYVTATTGAVSGIDAALSGKKELSGEISSLIKSMQDAGVYNASLFDRIDLQTGVAIKDNKLLTDRDIAKLQWDNLDSAQKLEVAGIWAGDTFKSDYFAEYVKQMSDVASQTGIVGSLVYGMPLAVTLPIAKSTTHQEVKPMEWAIAGATVAMAALPFVSPAVSALGVAGKATLGAIEAGSMAVFGENIRENWADMTVADKILNIGMLAAVPITKGAIKVTKAVAAFTRTLSTPEGMLPRGLKTGGMDLAYVEVPDLFRGVEGKVTDIIAKVSPDKQAAAIRELLNPENRLKFDSYMELAKLANSDLPDSMINRTVDFTNIKAIEGNAPVAEAIKMWFQQNSDDVVLGGSASRLQQLLGVDGVPIPKDFDVNIIKRAGGPTPESVAASIAEAIRKHDPTADVKVSGNKVLINGVDSFDIHYRGSFGKTPYGLPSLTDPITIDGIRFQSLQESMGDLINTSTVPGIGKSAGLMGPTVSEMFPSSKIEGKAGTIMKFGAHEGRAKDVMAVNVIFKGLADALDKSNPKLAESIRQNLYTIQSTSMGKVLPGAATDAAARNRFLKLVSDAQQAVLTGGDDALMVDPVSGGTLVRIASPSSKVVSGVLYTAVRDVTPYKESLSLGKPVEVGKVIGRTGGELKVPEDMNYKITGDKRLSGSRMKLNADGTPQVSANGRVSVTLSDGSVIDISIADANAIARTVALGPDAGKYITFDLKETAADRPQIFTSPDAAYDFLVDRTTGVLPKDAAIIAIRTTAEDLANPDLVGSPFRYERSSKGNLIVYDERTVASGAKLHPTDPTGLSMSGKGISGGSTGETITYYPRTKTDIPIMWLATDSAKTAGLGAPTLAQIRAINWMAFKGMVTDLLHPHLNTNIKFEFGETKAVRSSLLEFYKDTYKWKNGSRAEIVKAINEDTAALDKEAVANLNKKGALKDASPVERQRLIDEEQTRIVNDRVAEVLGNQKIMEQLVKETGSNVMGKYSINLSDLLGGLSQSAFVASALAPKVTTADVDPTTVSTPATSISGAAPAAGSVKITGPGAAPTAKPSQAVSPGTVTTAKAVESSTVAPSSTAKVTGTGEVTGTGTPETPITSKPPTTGTRTVPTIPTIPSATTAPTTPFRTSPITTEISTTYTTPTVTTPISPAVSVLPTPPSLSSPVTSPGPSTTSPPPPPTFPEPPRPPKRPSPPLKLPLLDSSTAESKSKLAPGTIVWLSGWCWKIVPPPYDQLKPISSRVPPVGIRRTGRTPAETIQIIGGPAPFTLDLDLGWTDAHIDAGSEEISFKGKGLATDIGKRITSVTTGMSVGTTSDADVANNVPMSGRRVRYNVAPRAKTRNRKVTTRRDPVDEFIYSSKGVL